MAMLPIRQLEETERAKRLESVNPLGREFFITWREQETTRVRHLQQVMQLTEKGEDLVKKFIEANHDEFINTVVVTSTRSKGEDAHEMLQLPYPFSKYYYRGGYFYETAGGSRSTLFPVANRLGGESLEQLLRNPNFIEALANCFRTKEV